MSWLSEGLHAITGIFGGGSSGSSGDSSQMTSVRFAPYVEEIHKEFLDTTNDYVEDTIDQSPYADYEELNFDYMFLGGYALTAFPSLYDMFGKFMAGLDVEAVYNEIFEDTINGPVVGNAIAAEADRIEDDFVENALPRFETGMRDINSVISSSFVVGRAVLEEERVKTVSRWSADFKARLMPIVDDRWKAHLGWNQSVISNYLQIIRAYILQKIDADNHNQLIETKDVLWPFTVLQYEGAALGALTGAKNVNTEVSGGNGPSGFQSTLGSMMSGAAAGAQVGGGWGALIGAGVGLLSSQ